MISTWIQVYKQITKPSKYSENTRDVRKGTLKQVNYKIQLYIQTLKNNQKNLLYWSVRELLRLEYRPYREYWRRFFTSNHELKTDSCLSVPENVSCIPRLQSTLPPRFLQLVLIAQSWSLRHTKLELPEQDEQPSLFQYKFSSLPFLNSSTYIKQEHHILVRHQIKPMQHQDLVSTIALTRVKLVTVNVLLATKAGKDLAAYFRPANATM